MYRIDNATSNAAPPTYPAPAAGQHFSKGNPGTGTPATVLEDWWCDQVQEEILAVLAQAGIAPAKGTNTQLRDSILAIAAGAVPSVSAPVGSFRNLKGSAAGGTETAVWTVDEAVVKTALGGNAYQGANLILNFNGGAANGPNAMDIGAMPVSGDLAVYLILDPAGPTWATLGTTTGHGAVYTGGHMPAGYTASALLWAGKTDGGSNIINFSQVDRRVSIPNTRALSQTSSIGAVTSLSLASIIPAAAKSIGGGVHATFNGGNSSAWIALYSSASASALGQVFAGETLTIASFGTHHSCFNDLILETAQTVYYETQVTGSGSPVPEVDLDISSYSI